MAVNSSFAAAIAAAARRKGLLPPAAPLAPVGSPAPDPQALVPDAQFLGEQAAYNRPYDTAVAQLPGNLQAGAADYGYSYNVDPTDPTKITVGGVDPSNPNSRAALLQRSYDASNRGIGTSMASRGQLYAGATQNAKNSAFTNFNQASAENQRGFQDLIRGFVGNLGQLGAERDVNQAQALGGLTERRTADPNQPPSMYAGVAYDAPTPEQPFARPLGTPTAASVMASKSLLGTALDPASPLFRPFKPAPVRKPKRKP